VHLRFCGNGSGTLQLNECCELTLRVQGNNSRDHAADILCYDYGPDRCNTQRIGVSLQASSWLLADPGADRFGHLLPPRLSSTNAALMSDLNIQEGRN
jgi:hypothetical protein